MKLVVVADDGAEGVEVAWDGTGGYEGVRAALQAALALPSVTGFRYVDAVDQDEICVFTDDDVAEFLEHHAAHGVVPRISPVVDGRSPAKQTLELQPPTAVQTEEAAGEAVVRLPPRTNWGKGSLLGSGSTGKVYLGIDHDRGDLFAVKEVLHFGDSDSATKNVKREIEMMKYLSHPNIVRYLGTQETSTALHVMMEYVPGGSISNLLLKLGPFSEHVIRLYTAQICAGLQYLHERHIFHRDIKGGNCLVDIDGTVKLADFGCSIHLAMDPSGQFTAPAAQMKQSGTSLWMSPEAVQCSEQLSLPSDIWSLGCTIIEMATGRPPWGEANFINEWAAMYYISKAATGPPIPHYLSLQAHQLLWGCFKLNPDERPVVDAILDHEFITVPFEENSDHPGLNPPPLEMLSAAPAFPTQDNAGGGGIGGLGSGDMHSLHTLGAGAGGEHSSCFTPLMLSDDDGEDYEDDPFFRTQTGDMISIHAPSFPSYTHFSVPEPTGLKAGGAKVAPPLQANDTAAASASPWERQEDSLPRGETNASLNSPLVNIGSPTAHLPSLAPTTSSVGRSAVAPLSQDVLSRVELPAQEVPSPMSPLTTLPPAGAQVDPPALPTAITPRRRDAVEGGTPKKDAAAETVMAQPTPTSVEKQPDMTAEQEEQPPPQNGRPKSGKVGAGAKAVKGETDPAVGGGRQRASRQALPEDISGYLDGVRKMKQGKMDGNFLDLMGRQLPRPSLAPQPDATEVPGWARGGAIATTAEDRVEEREGGPLNRGVVRTVDSRPAMMCLPDGVVYAILYFLDHTSLCHFALCSSNLQYMVDKGRNEAVWRALFYRDFGAVSPIRSSLRSGWKAYYARSARLHQAIVGLQYEVTRKLAVGNKIYEGTWLAGPCEMGAVQQQQQQQQRRVCKRSPTPRKGRGGSPKYGGAEGAMEAAATTHPREGTPPAQRGGSASREPEHRGTPSSRRQSSRRETPSPPHAEPLSAGAVRRLSASQRRRSAGEQRPQPPGEPAGEAPAEVQPAHDAAPDPDHASAPPDGTGGLHPRPPLRPLPAALTEVNSSPVPAGNGCDEREPDAREAVPRLRPHNSFGDPTRHAERAASAGTRDGQTGDADATESAAADAAEADDGRRSHAGVPQRVVIKIQQRRERDTPSAQNLTSPYLGSTQQGSAVSFLKTLTANATQQGALFSPNTTSMGTLASHSHIPHALKPVLTPPKKGMAGRGQRYSPTISKTPSKGRIALGAHGVTQAYPSASGAVGLHASGGFMSSPPLVPQVRGAQLTPLGAERGGSNGGGGLWNGTYQMVPHDPSDPAAHDTGVEPPPVPPAAREARRTHTPAGAASPPTRGTSRGAGGGVTSPPTAPARALSRGKQTLPLGVPPIAGGTPPSAPTGTPGSGQDASTITATAAGAATPTPVYTRSDRTATPQGSGLGPAAPYTFHTPPSPPVSMIRGGAYVGGQSGGHASLHSSFQMTGTWGTAHSALGASSSQAGHTIGYSGDDPNGHRQRWVSPYEYQTEQERSELKKREERRDQSSDLHTEYKFLRDLCEAGVAGVVEPLWFGPLDGVGYALVTQRGGPSLNEVLLFSGNRFCCKTVCLIALRALNILEGVHMEGVVHGNICPSTLITALPQPSAVAGNGDGVGDHSDNAPDAFELQRIPRDLLLVNFSTARMWRDKKSYKIVSSRRAPKIRTREQLYFSSINLQMECTPSPRDDLMSLAYMLLFFLHGNLPWLPRAAIGGAGGAAPAPTGKAYAQRSREVIAMKKKILHDTRQLRPQQLHHFLRYATSLRANQMPDYPLLRNMFQALLPDPAAEREPLFDSWPADE